MKKEKITELLKQAGDLKDKATKGVGNVRTAIDVGVATSKIVAGKASKVLNKDALSTGMDVTSKGVEMAAKGAEMASKSVGKLAEGMKFASKGMKKLSNKLKDK